MSENLPAFGMGDHFNKVMNVIQARFMTFVLIAGILAVITVALGLVLGIDNPIIGIVNFFTYAIAGPLSMIVAYSAVTGRQSDLGADFQLTLKAFVPLVIVSLIQGLMVSIGLIFLIIPGLYLMAMVYVALPVIMVENKGMNALDRSISLTSGYRWTLVGLTILLLIFLIVLSVGAFFVAELLTVLPLVGPFLYAFIENLIWLVPGISAALVYWRLVEHKEGKSIEEIVSVFD